MAETSIHPVVYPQLNDQTQFRLNEINRSRDYFIVEVGERKVMSKGLSNYIAAFDCFNKALIDLHAKSGEISIALFATVIGAPIGKTSASFSFPFSINTGIVRKLLKTTQNHRKKHNKIFILARSKLNSVETLISKVLIDSKESIRMIKSPKK